MLDIRGEEMLVYDHQILSKKNVNQKIGGSLRIFLEKFNFKSEYKIKKSNIVFRNPSNGSLGVVFDREKALLIGGYESKFFPSSDYYFNSKYIQKYGGIFFNKKLTKYRFHVNESLKLENLKSFCLSRLSFEKRYLLQEF